MQTMVTHSDITALEEDLRKSQIMKDAMDKVVECLQKVISKSSLKAVILPACILNQGHGVAQSPVLLSTRCAYSGPTSILCSANSLSHSL